MKNVNLADKHGNVKTKHVGYSAGFLFLGPIYLFAKVHIFSGIFFVILYYYLLPIPGMEIFINLVSPILNSNQIEILSRFLLFFRGQYPKYVGIIIVILMQLIISFFIEGLLLRRAIRRKKLFPITENDARILISIHACNTKVELATNRNYSTNDDNYYQNKKINVPYILDDIDNTKISSFKKIRMQKEIENLNELYNLQQMTREEYEIRRAKIIKDYK